MTKNVKNDLKNSHANETDLWPREYRLKSSKKKKNLVFYFCLTFVSWYLSIMSSIVSEIKCSIIYTKKKKKLHAHLKNIHGSDSLAVNNFICTKTSDNHTKKYHTNVDGNRETRIICLYECNEPLFKYSKLRIHLFEKHNITIEVKEITFSTIAEFEKRKTEKEQKIFSKFILDKASTNYIMVLQGHIIIAIDRLTIEKPKMKLRKQERQNL
ncbi:hypothetical protein AGLY_014417 [Aphis glycines]|uniref:C2H2-type domain-containing protein n=1 Tax=Aphis glycines TaxID=307491 RepID=A0A6G0T3F8_APHGL|nr:hypothetical protein AGLY_014417 [Aphis glycines]